MPVGQLLGLGQEGLGLSKRARAESRGSLEERARIRQEWPGAGPGQPRDHGVQRCLRASC
jgi:hypothetical protein